MPTKHIDELTWRKVEKETVRAVISSQASLKDTEVLKLLILKGIAATTEDDYKELARLKENKKK